MKRKTNKLKTAMRNMRNRFSILRILETDYAI